MSAGLEAVTAWLARETGLGVADGRPAGGGHGVRHYRASLADGREIFIKESADATALAVRGAGAPPARTGMPAVGQQGDAGQPPDWQAGAAGGAGQPPGRFGLAAEAAGLRWLGSAGQVPVPDVIAESDGRLATSWVPADGGPDRTAAERFGRELARLHLAGADRFGAPWSGFIASLPLPNEQSDSWPAWYAECRLLPYCRIARDRGAFDAAEAALVESVAARLTRSSCPVPAEPPHRIHGDLWSGNLLWSGGRGWLIDPAAHGGNRESDLAMLALFGARHLDRIVAAYQEVAPLTDGWRHRVPLHQLHPLLVHVCLFGESYRASALTAAHAALAALSV